MIVLLIVQPPKPTVITQTEAGQICHVLDLADMHAAVQAVFTTTRSACGRVLLTHPVAVAIDLETSSYGWLHPTGGVLVRLAEVR